jgi:hypothetical protein
VLEYQVLQVFLDKKYRDNNNKRGLKGRKWPKARKTD